MSKPASQQGGFRKKEVKEFEEEVVQIDRVTRVVKGGRKMRFRATVVVGNRRGKVGIGIGKSVEVTGAIQKGIAQAKKDMLDVKMDGSTIPHDIKIKFKAARILLMPAVPGTGLIAGGTVRKVLELAGIKDILSKCFGTTNKVNNTKATFKALQLLKETPGMAKRKLKKATDKAAQDAARVAAAAAPKAPEKKAEAPHAHAPEKSMRLRRQKLNN
jgi:small subunit ribosomal protein S5